MDSKYNLSDRLIDFSIVVQKISQRLPKNTAATHIATQVVRSSSSPALHYGEAQAAESPKDFIHKMKVGLKELRETFNALRIAKKMSWLPDKDIDPVIDENNQLISIFYTSIKTATNNMNNKDNKKNKKRPNDNENQKDGSNN